MNFVDTIINGIHVGKDDYDDNEGYLDDPDVEEDMVFMNETKEYKYSKEVMNELRNMIKSFDNDFVEYDKDEIYNILIYDTNTDKALYDPDSYELINLTNRLILGQK